MGRKNILFGDTFAINYLSLQYDWGKILVITRRHRLSSLIEDRQFKKIVKERVQSALLFRIDYVSREYKFFSSSYFGIERGFRLCSQDYKFWRAFECWG